MVRCIQRRVFPKFLLKIFQPKYKTISTLVKVTNEYVTRVCPHVASKRPQPIFHGLKLEPKVEGFQKLGYALIVER